MISQEPNVAEEHQSDSESMELLKKEQAIAVCMFKYAFWCRLLLQVSKALSGP